jgi:hypothetical protein
MNGSSLFFGGIWTDGLCTIPTKKKRSPGYPGYPRRLNIRVLSDVTKVKLMPEEDNLSLPTKINTTLVCLANRMTFPTDFSD